MYDKYNEDFLKEIKSNEDFEKKMLSEKNRQNNDVKNFYFFDFVWVQLLNTFLKKSFKNTESTRLCNDDLVSFNIYILF